MDIGFTVFMKKHTTNWLSTTPSCGRKSIYRRTIGEIIILEPEPKVSHQHLKSPNRQQHSQVNCSSWQLPLRRGPMTLESTVWSQARSSTNCYWKQLDTIILNINKWKRNEYTKKWATSKTVMLRVRSDEGITHTQIHNHTPVHNPRSSLSNKYIEHLQQNECLMNASFSVTVILTE